MENLRIERKWVFRKIDHLLVLNSLLRSKFFFKYHYPSRRINSIYYDDINLSNITQNLDGIISSQIPSLVAKQLTMEVYA